MKQIISSIFHNTSKIKNTKCLLPLHMKYVSYFYLANSIFYWSYYSNITVSFLLFLYFYLHYLLLLVLLQNLLIRLCPNIEVIFTLSNCFLYCAQEYYLNWGIFCFLLIYLLKYLRRCYKLIIFIMWESK